jgi:hypothetical protein
MIAKWTAHSKVNKVVKYPYFKYFRHSKLQALISNRIFSKL